MTSHLTWYWRLSLSRFVRLALMVSTPSVNLWTSYVKTPVTLTTTSHIANLGLPISNLHIYDLSVFYRVIQVDPLFIKALTVVGQSWVWPLQGPKCVQQKSMTSNLEFTRTWHITEISSILKQREDVDVQSTWESLKPRAQRLWVRARRRVVIAQNKSPSDCSTTDVSTATFLNECMPFASKFPFARKPYILCYTAVSCTIYCVVAAYLAQVSCVSRVETLLRPLAVD